jgi:hypothetical protein
MELRFVGTELGLPSAPVITNFRPAVVTFGGGLLVTGRGFQIVTAIKINGLTLDYLTVLSDTAAFGTIPAGATTGQIEVVNSLGIAVSSENCIVDPNNIYEWFRLYAQPEDFLFKL